MHAELSPSVQRIKLALQACPYVGATLLVDDNPRPGEPSDGSMFCATFALPSSAILRALGQLEKILPSSLPAWIGSHGGLFGLLLEAPEALDALAAPSCSARGLDGFNSSAAFANVHERKLWSLIHDDGEQPLLGLAVSYYGSGGDGKLGRKTYHSRDAFSCLWAALAQRLAERFDLPQTPDISEALVSAPHLHGFHTELPQGLQNMWRSQAENGLLLAQIGPALAGSKPRPSL